uniref:Sporangia induced predicted protein putative n=1 Tax=Albugo laibachii Nc14 TaxID=890382 RepID=F0WIG0_9STRA|nr:sporangia induced predicted protein putative [Albugo laibachii Nc14]|eukprot:CCA21042.1 sporangia induced predicted protein putative [Albugo laibachii Nc14]
MRSILFAVQIAFGIAQNSSDPCSTYVSSGDFAAGITAYYDDGCVEKGGLGCFAAFCRLCRFQNTSKSAHLMVCPLSGTPQTPELTSSECANVVPRGDADVGISAYMEPTCTTSSLNGCFPNSNPCRFCKLWNTIQSANFIACPSTTSNPVSTPTPVIPPPAPAPVASCDAAVSASGLVSISYVVNSQCYGQPNLEGCVANTNCQLCRQTKNEENQFLISCKVLQPARTEAFAIPIDDFPTKVLTVKPQVRAMSSSNAEQPIAISMQATSKSGFSAFPVAAVMAGVLVLGIAAVAVQKRVRHREPIDEMHHDETLRDGSFVKVEQGDIDGIALM